MRRFLVFLASICLFFVFAETVTASNELKYKSFDSRVSINQDLSIMVSETIVVEYLVPKHGIFRNIPEKRLKVLSVKDESGNDYEYKVSGGSIKEIKIGDPDIAITGEHIYVIVYEVKDAVKEFSDHFELYWNITGSDWDSLIPKPTASLESRFASITKIKCFAGVVGASVEDCTGDFESNRATFNSQVNTGVGSDFTIVVGLDKNNQFIQPSTIQKVIDWFMQNWFYFITPLPFLIPFYFWLKKGRDQRFVSENIYYEPNDTATRSTGLFERKFIPLVYSPIKGLTPSQVGTIIDEKVDIADVVAEIIELARLGYLKIKRIPQKGIFGKGDYEFTKISKEAKLLADYQKTVLNGLFEEGDTTFLSDLKNKFYLNLKDFREELYENMKSRNFFEGNPEKIRGYWFTGLFVICLVVFLVINFLGIIEENFWPMLPLAFFSILGFLFARAMPRRTPRGYALFRQIEGLKWYINKGLWRQEIAEKRLFIDEMLPLAISLGVVGKLAEDMKILGIEPPKYIGGVSTASFAGDIGIFQSSAGSVLASAPGGSGGSGFGGGGGSGGGGGGGGGGGW